MQPEMIDSKQRGERLCVRLILVQLVNSGLQLIGFTVNLGRTNRDLHYCIIHSMEPANFSWGNQQIQGF